MDSKAPPKFGFSRLVEEIDRVKQTGGGPDALDRRTVLAALSRTIGAEEEVLLRRGFDRAYRRIVEGV